MIEFDGLIGLITLGLWLFCIIDVITSADAGIRNLPKLLWLFLVIILPLIGSVAWLVAGRPARGGASGLPYKGNRGVNPGTPARGFATPDRRGYGSRPSRPGPSAPAARAANPDDDAEFQATLRRRVEEQRRKARGEDD